MKFYQEKSFNSINWLLCNIKTLNLNSEETIILLQILLAKQYNEDLNLEQLVNRTNLSDKIVDDTLAKLTSKGYLKIKTEQMKVIFDIDSIYNKKNSINENTDIFELFESELGKVLSQMEMVTISEWLQVYDNDTIISALREALINNKKSIKYIEKILSNGK